MQAVCESFISYFRVVKSGWRNRLNECNLTDLMCNKVTGPTLHVFRERFCELAVDLWNSDKSRRKTQRNRKQYAARGNASKRTRGKNSLEIGWKTLELWANRYWRVRKMKRRWKLIYRGSCHRTGQEIPLVTSAQWELSDSSEDSGCEDPSWAEWQAVTLSYRDWWFQLNYSRPTLVFYSGSSEKNPKWTEHQIL
jgi:hypothetical protein